MFDTSVQTDDSFQTSPTAGQLTPRASTMLLPYAARPLPATLVATRLLTPREIEVLAWLAEGKSDWQVGQILLISPKTVNYHVERAKKKLDVATRMQAVVTAVRRGLLEAPTALFTLIHEPCAD